LVVQAPTNKTQTPLAFSQFAVTRANIALHSTVRQLMPKLSINYMMVRFEFGIAHGVPPIIGFDEALNCHNVMFAENTPALVIFRGNS